MGTLLIHSFFQPRKTDNRNVPMRPAQQWGEEGEKKHENCVTFGSEKDMKSFCNIMSLRTTVL